MRNYALEINISIKTRRKHRDPLGPKMYVNIFSGTIFMFCEESEIQDRLKYFTMDIEYKNMKRLDNVKFIISYRKIMKCAYDNHITDDRIRNRIRVLNAYGYACHCR